MCAMKNQTISSHEIKVNSCPLTTSELEDLSRRASFEELVGKVRRTAKSDQFDARHKDIEFDDDRGIACQTTKG